MNAPVSPRHTHTYTIAVALMVLSAMIAMYFINERTEAERTLVGISNAHIVGNAQ